MPIYNKFLNQIISSTHLDGQGEKMSKEFFEKLIASTPARMPLHQQHEMIKETLGYLENFRIVENETHECEWNVIADVYITSENPDEALKGFSYSITEPMVGNLVDPEYYIYLPYPHYNDTTLIEEILKKDDGLMVGKWVKKSLDPLTIGLLATGVAFALAPEWDIQYKENIRPVIKKSLSLLPTLLKRNIAIDFMQVVIYQGKSVSLYLIPIRGDEENSYQDEFIYKAIIDAETFLTSDLKSNTVGVERLKFYYAPTKNKYNLFHVQYSDGSDMQVTRST